VGTSRRQTKKLLTRRIRNMGKCDGSGKNGGERWEIAWRRRNAGFKRIEEPAGRLTRKREKKSSYGVGDAGEKAPLSSQEGRKTVGKLKRKVTTVYRTQRTGKKENLVRFMSRVAYRAIKRINKGEWRTLIRGHADPKREWQ